MEHELSEHERIDVTLFLAGMHLPDSSFGELQELLIGRLIQELQKMVPAK